MAPVPIWLESPPCPPTALPSQRDCLDREASPAIAAYRDTRSQEAELRAAVVVADPVWPNAPPAAAFAPLVFLLASVAPFLHAAAHAWLTPDAAAWGLRGLDILSAGDWGQPGEPARPTPPVLPWCACIMLAWPGVDPLLAPALQAACFGVGSCFLLGRLGAVWHSPAVGLVATFLLAFNGHLLDDVRLGGDGPATTFFALAALVAFAEHLARQDALFSRWTVVGIAAFAGLSLVAGWFVGWLAALGLVALAYRYAAFRKTGRYIVEHLLTDSTLHAGMAVLAGGAALALPWWLQSGLRAGPYSPWEIPAVEAFVPAAMRDALSAMPVVAALGLAGLLRSLREIWRLGPDAETAALPAAWIVVSALALATIQPTAGARLTLAAALTLSASSFLLDLLARRVPDRMGATALVAAVGAGAFVDPSQRSWIGVDGGVWFLGAVALLAVALGGSVWRLFRWSSGRDERRRFVLGGLSATAFLLALVPGLARLRGPTRADDPWESARSRLRTLVARRVPDLAVVIDASAPANPPRYDARSAIPRYVLRTLLPNVEMRFVASPAALSTATNEFRNPIVFVFEGQDRMPEVFAATFGSRTITLAERLRHPKLAAYTAAEPEPPP